MNDVQPAPPEERKTTMKHADVPFVIDFHTHMLDEELRAICTSRNAITGFGKKPPPPSSNLRKFLEPELQIADMDERGIDMHVVFTGPVHMSTWWADPQTAAKLTRRMNDIIGLGGALSEALRRHRHAADAGCRSCDLGA